MNRLISILTLSAAALSAQITPPPQPTTGPGGSDYPFASSVTLGPYNNTLLGGANSYYIIQPASPTPASAPIILFIHGYDGNKLKTYNSWMDHMAMMGYTVIWINYDTLETGKRFEPKILSDFQDALGRIAGGGFVPAMLDGNGVPITAVSGHSSGAFLTFALAADSNVASNNIPVFKAIVAIEPGQGSIPNYDLSGISPSTKEVIVVGDEDKTQRVCQASSIWQQTSQIPDSNRDFLEVISDTYGVPQQLGNHWFPLTDTKKDTVPPPNSVDDRDYNITYKLSVGAFNCAIFGTDCSYGLGHGSSDQINMGSWSDGTTVHPLLWIADPVSTFQTLCASASASATDTYENTDE